MVSINLKLSNRAIYSIIAFGIMILLGIGVYAVAGVSHDASELNGLGALATKNSISFNELTYIPVGFADGEDNYRRLAAKVYDCSYPYVTVTNNDCRGTCIGLSRATTCTDGGDRHPTLGYCGGGATPPSIRNCAFSGYIVLENLVGQ